MKNEVKTTRLNHAQWLKIKSDNNYGYRVEIIDGKPYLCIIKKVGGNNGEINRQI